MKQTPRKKNGVEDEIQPVASQGGPTPAMDSNTPSIVDSPRATHMETTDIGEELVQNLRPSLSPIIWVINSTSIPSPSDNCPHDFKSHIAEIDSALKKFDSPQSLQLLCHLSPSHNLNPMEILLK